MHTLHTIGYFPFKQTHTATTAFVICQVPMQILSRELIYEKDVGSSKDQQFSKKSDFFLFAKDFRR